MLQPPSASSREFGTPPPRSSTRRRQKRRLMQASAVALIGLAIVGAYSWGQAAKPADPDPKRQVATRVLRLGKALEAYAAHEERDEKDGPAYPRTAEFLTFVRGLPRGAEFLANPYGEPPQAAPVAAGGETGLPSAADHKEGARVPLPDTVLGPGTAPGPAYTARTFGALVYDHDPKTDSFVLYGIGQQGDQAVVAAEADSGL